MILTIKRISDNTDGTFGVIMLDDKPFALTVERRWLNNAQSVSCIPAGTYTCRRVQSPHFGDTFEVTDVPGRSHILLHKGNVMDDSHGCIIIGEQFGELHDKCAVLSSKAGFNEFKRITQGRDFFVLEIIDATDQKGD